MVFGLTTRWNARRHRSGESMIEEILELGIDHVELGYDTRRDLIPGVQSMVEQGAVSVDSVHNFCPVPMTVSRGHPEIYTFADRDPRVRQQAVRHTTTTIRFAAEVGAKERAHLVGVIDAAGEEDASDEIRQPHGLGQCPLAGVG